MSRKILIIGLSLFALAAVFFASGAAAQQKAKSSPKAAAKPLPNLTLNTTGGQKWSLEDSRGRIVLVNYWATWCPPCRAETPGLVRLADEYKSRGLIVVGVTMDENLTDVPPFIEKYKIKYPVLFPGIDSNLVPGGMSLPTTFLYDKNGRLAKKYVGIVLESTFKSDVETLLAE